MDRIDCKTSDDVMIYLVSNLNYISEEIKIGDWKQIMGFRTSYFVSQVWYNVEINEWAFHISDDEYKGIPNMGTYSSFTELLNGVVKKYSNSWNLT